MSCPTHPAAPTPRSASSGRQCLVGECGFSASWTGCTQWLCPESVLEKPEDLNKQTSFFFHVFLPFATQFSLGFIECFFVLEEANQWPVNKRPSSPRRHTAFFFPVLQISVILTFSPCKAGTESLKPWKLSLMWSLRLRSSALWCARLSACEEKGQIEDVPGQLCEDNICKLCCSKLTRLHTKGHRLLHFKRTQLVYNLFAQSSCLTSKAWFRLQYERKFSI